MISFLEIVNCIFSKLPCFPYAQFVDEPPSPIQQSIQLDPPVIQSVQPSTHPSVNPVPPLKAPSPVERANIKALEKSADHIDVEVNDGENGETYSISGIDSPDIINYPRVRIHYKINPNSF